MKEIQDSKVGMGISLSGSRGTFPGRSWVGTSPLELGLKRDFRALEMAITVEICPR